ncbi:hypothetical protein ACTXT7_017455, partial [Hymenolepis weldensis]
MLEYELLSSLHFPTRGIWSNFPPQFSRSGQGGQLFLPQEALATLPQKESDRDDIWHGESNANTVRSATSCNPLEFAHNSLSIVKRHPQPVGVNELQFSLAKSQHLENH